MVGRSLFVAFEGIDGAGKTTQLSLLAAYLERKGVQVICTRQPGGTELGQELRRLLLVGRKKIYPLTEALLYAADRAQHVEEVIRPALSAGKAVLCDRFIDSTVAYQGFGRGVDRQFLSQLNYYITGGLKPDLTFLLDLPPAEMLNRIGPLRSCDRMEAMGLHFYQRVREGFLILAAAEPERYVVLDATLPPDELHRQVVASVAQYLWWRVSGR